MKLHAFERHEAALEFYDLAEQRAQREGRWPHLRAVVLQELGRSDDAAAAYRRAIAAAPRYAPARLRLANLLLDKGVVEEAAELYQSALQIDAASAAAEYGLGRIAAARGEDSVAIGRFERAIALAPDYSPPRYSLAQALRRSGQTQRAAAVLAEFEARPKVSEALFDPWVSEVESLAIAPASARVSRGKQLADQGMHRAAIAEYERALQTDPTFVAAHVNLMTSYGALGDYQRVEEHYRRAKELGSEAVELDYNFGVMRLHQGRFQEAIEALERALKKHPGMADAQSNLGYAFEQVGRPAAALERYQEAVRLEPNHRIARYHLGRRLLAAGRPKEALAALEPAREPADAGAVQVLYQIGKAHAAVGDKEQAADAWQAAKQAAEAAGRTEAIPALERALAAVRE